MKQNLKPILIGFITATLISSIAVYFIYQYLKTDFDYRVASAKKIEVRISQDHVEAYEEGFLDCMRSLNPNVYAAYLRCIVEYGTGPISDSEFSDLAKQYELGAYQLDFVKVLLFTAETSDTTQAN